MSRKKNNNRNPLGGEPMGAETLDEVLQAQLEHFAKVTRMGTGSDFIVLISHVEKDGKLQTAISSRGGTGPDGQLSEAVRAMVTVAATTLEHLTEGKAKLVLKFGDNEYDATGGAEAMMLRREYGE